MSELRQTVFVVDDDEAVCDSLSMLVRSVGLEAETFPGAAAFLESYDPDRSGCLVLDIRIAWRDAALCKVSAFRAEVIKE